MLAQPAAMSRSRWRLRASPVDLGWTAVRIRRGAEASTTGASIAGFGSALTSARKLEAAFDELVGGRRGQSG